FSGALDRLIEKRAECECGSRRIARTERLSIASKHRPKPDVRKLDLDTEQLHQREHLLEMERLPMIDDVERAIGPELLFSVVDGGDIGRRIEKGSITLLDQEGFFLLFEARRDLTLLLAPKDRLRSRVFSSDAARDEIVDDAFERVVIGALTEIKIEAHIEQFIDRIDRLPCHIDEFGPERAVFGIAILELLQLAPRGFGKLFIFFGARRGHFIDALELDDGIGVEGRAIAIRTHPDDQKSKLRPPIAEVIVADDFMSPEFEHTRDGVSDDRRAEMAD